MLYGDLGRDTMNGGGGVDTFIFSGNAALHDGGAGDFITDFQVGTDRLSIGFSVGTVLTGNAEFDFAHAAAAAQLLLASNPEGNEVALIRVGTDCYIFYSSNNGPVADSAVQLVGLDPATISSTDFV